MTIWKLTDKEPVKINGKNLPADTPAHIPKNDPDLADRANSFIAGGNYIIAMGIYRSLLAKDSSNVHLLQKVEDLRSLILLSGMRKDLIVFRLEKFLEMIMKRGSEFTERPRNNL